ncbi:hypothetical protein ABID97_001949 [Variovorax sp. OAS795]|uniref:hypothetical protein n=1 Tax=Variovorax sp. OAS795 TaxID=3034231 RepID=UPI00339A3006
MPIVSQDILDCASEMTKATKGIEAFVRAAVARSYYAAFHDCLEWHSSLPAQGHLPPKFLERGTHVELAFRLLNPDQSLSKDLQESSKKRGLALRNLHADRVVADYKLSRTVNAYEARTALASARKIVSL